MLIVAARALVLVGAVRTSTFARALVLVATRASVHVAARHVAARTLVLVVGQEGLGARRP